MCHIWRKSQLDGCINKQDTTLLDASIQDSSKLILIVFAFLLDTAYHLWG